MIADCFLRGKVVTARSKDVETDRRLARTMPMFLFNNTDEDKRAMRLQMGLTIATGDVRPWIKHATTEEEVDAFATVCLDLIDNKRVVSVDDPIPASVMSYRLAITEEIDLPAYSEALGKVVKGWPRFIAEDDLSDKLAQANPGEGDKWHWIEKIRREFRYGTLAYESVLTQQTLEVESKSLGKVPRAFITLGLVE